MKELDRLRMEEPAKDIMGQVILSVFLSFRRLYGKRWWVTEEELKGLASPDARKIELFYKGMLKMLNAESRRRNRAQGLMKVKSKPGSFGISLN